MTIEAKIAQIKQCLCHLPEPYLAGVIISPPADRLAVITRHDSYLSPWENTKTLMLTYPRHLLDDLIQPLPLKLGPQQQHE